MAERTSHVELRQSNRAPNCEHVWNPDIVEYCKRIALSAKCSEKRQQPRLHSTILGRINEVQINVLQPRPVPFEPFRCGQVFNSLDKPAAAKIIISQNATWVICPNARSRWSNLRSHQVPQQRKRRRSGSGTDLSDVLRIERAHEPCKQLAVFRRHVLTNNHALLLRSAIAPRSAPRAESIARSASAIRASSALPGSSSADRISDRSTCRAAIFGRCFRNRMRISSMTLRFKTCSLGVQGHP